jgi:hypothetical protein
MQRIEALRIFRREYFHAIRNGKNSQQAADQATTRLKDWFLKHLAFQNIPEVDRMEEWGKIIDVIIEWQILLKDIPIDVSKIPPKPPIERIGDPSIKPRG